MSPVSSRMVTRCLRGAALSPMRNVARSTSACVTCGYSSRSSEVGEEEQWFIFVALAHGNNTDFLCCFGMHNHHDFHTQQPERDPTLFTIVLAVVFKSEGRTCEDSRSVGEIHSMLVQVGLPFGFVPDNSHGL